MELLVAMVIGIFLVGGVLALFLASKKSYSETERMARVGESGRYAMQLLAENLRLAGFFGATSSPNPDLHPDLGSVTGDCSGNAAAYDFSALLRVERVGGTGAVFGCITDAMPGTDAVVVKSVRPFPLTDGARNNFTDDDGVFDSPEGIDAKKVYIISNNIASQIFRGNASPVPTSVVAGGEAWEYRFQIFYIRNTTSGPRLSRRILSSNAAGTGMELSTQDLASGVEQLRVTPLARQTDGQLANASTLPDAPVSALRISIMVRSLDIDPEYTDDRKYYLDGEEVVLPATEKKYRRTTLQESVFIRNSALFSL